jgi:hypothetical protein
MCTKESGTSATKNWATNTPHNGGSIMSRERRTTRIAMSLMFLTGLVGLGQPASADPVPPVGDQVLENGTFVITEPVIIGPASSLTIRNATVYLDFPTYCPTQGSAGYCQPQIMLLGGTLKVLNSTIDTHLYDPAVINSGYAIASIGGELHIRNSVVRHARIVGAQGEARGPSTVIDSQIVDGYQGLNFTRGTEAVVRGNLFENLMFGVAAHDGRSFIIDNVFRNISKISGTGNPFGRAIDVQATIVGEKAFDTVVFVEGNTVVDSHQALLSLTNFATVIRDNVFRRNKIGSTIGIPMGDDMLHDEIPTYTSNQLINNETSIQLYASGNPREATEVTVPLQGNSFIDRGCIDVEIMPTAATVTLKADASQSWWGHEDGPVAKSSTCPATKGAVVVEPWLQEPPEGS